MWDCTHRLMMGAALPLVLILPLSHTPAHAQLRGGVDAQRTAQATDPATTSTGFGVGQPTDQSAPYATRSGATASGATASGATSRRASVRTTRPVRAPVKPEAAQLRRDTRTPVSVIDTPPPPPVTRRRRPVTEEDPFAAVGVDVGGITLRPAITVSGGYDDNPNRAPTGRGARVKGSWLARTDAEVTARSDWSIHQFTGEIRGGYSRYFSAEDASRPDGTGRGTLRLDFSRDTQAELEGRFSLDTQRPGSPELNARVIGRPMVYGYGASAGISHNWQPVTLSLRGAVDRTTYEDGKLSNGGVARQTDRNATQYTLRTRAAYEASPGLKPFVEAAIDTRQFDESTDIAGFKRSSTGLTGRAGATMELTRLVTGEASLGYQTRDYEDTRLTNLRGLIGDASLVWTATELTTVTLRGAMELNDTTLPGVNGAVARRADLQVAHAVLRNVTVTGIAGWSQQKYDGAGLTENTLQLGARAEWKLSRTMAVRASFTHERLNSTTIGADYTANVYLLGMRFQL
ncbi:MAG: outer membrane beta-barrel protein [Bosea sp. (in: a-proteobacteria)]